MYRLQVPRLHCDNCAGRVTRAIQGVDPDALVLPDIEKRVITVETSADEPAVRAALEKAGYPVVDGPMPELAASHAH